MFLKPSGLKDETMKTTLRTLLFLCCSLIMALFAGCGGGGGNSTPTTSSTSTSTPTSTNKIPVIVSGPTPADSSISASSTTTVSISATDPDGDALTYSWYASCGTISGTSSSVTYTAPSTTGTCTIIAAALDGKGGSISNYTSITVIPQAPQQVDVVEPNDTIATATPATFGVWYNGNLCVSNCSGPDSTDYFKISTSSTAKTVRVFMTNAKTDQYGFGAIRFGVEVYDSSGKYTRNHYEASQPVDTTFYDFSVNPNSTYYVLIGNLDLRYSPPSSSAKYSVIFRERNS